MTKVDARYQKSREAIVEAAITRLLANPEASVSEIALAAGVGRATLYRHFETRQDLINALTLLCLDETDQALQPIVAAGLTGLDAIVASIQVIMPMAARFRFLMSLADSDTLDRTVKLAYQRQLDELTTYVEQGKADGAITAALPTAWVVASYDAQLNAAWSLVQFGQLTEAEATSAFISSFRASLMPVATSLD